MKSEKKYTYIDIYTYIHIHIHTYTDIYTHTHMHTHRYIYVGFFEVAIESWPEWDLNPGSLNSIQML